jgi:hypothetical protein
MTAKTPENILAYLQNQFQEAARIRASLNLAQQQTTATVSLPSEFKDIKDATPTAPVNLVGSYPFGCLKNPLESLDTIEAELKNFSVILERARAGMTEDDTTRKNRQNYSPGDIALAVQMRIEQKMTYKQINEHFGSRIPRSTLQDHVERTRAGLPINPPGRPTTLNVEHERWLAVWIFFCYRCGVPPKKCRIRRKAREVGEKAGVKFTGKHGLPSNGWWRRFRKRYKIKLGSCSHRSRAAAEGLTRASLNHFYDLLYSLIQEYNIPCEMLWATDETGFQRTTASGLVAMPVGGDAPKAVGDEIGTHITLQGCVSAKGDRTPFFLLLKGQGARLTHNPLEGLPKDSAVIYTPKAWNNEKSFFLWIRWFAWQLDSRYPDLRAKGQHALLLVDGHASRFNPDMSNMPWLTTLLCSAILLILPPRSR